MLVDGKLTAARMWRGRHVPRFEPPSRTASVASSSGPERAQSDSSVPWSRTQSPSRICPGRAGPMTQTTSATASQPCSPPLSCSMVYSAEARYHLCAAVLSSMMLVAGLDLARRRDHSALVLLDVEPDRLTVTRRAAPAAGSVAPAVRPDRTAPRRPRPPGL